MMTSRERVKPIFYPSILILSIINKKVARFDPQKWAIVLP